MDEALHSSDIGREHFLYDHTSFIITCFSYPLLDLSWYPPSFKHARARTVKLFDLDHLLFVTSAVAGTRPDTLLSSRAVTMIGPALD